MQSTTFSSRRILGFTLIEVIAVLILLGIISVIAIANPSLDTDRWVNPDVFASHLRYAQSRAMAMEEPWGIETKSDGTYTMFKIHNGTKQTVPLPGGSISGKKVPRGTWWFNEMGEPHSGAYSNSAKPVTQDIVINVSQKRLIITALTGYIH